MNAAHDDLSDRIRKLERQNKFLIRGGALSLVALAGISLMSMRTVCDTVSAERFVLLDAQGKQRALLTAYETGGAPKFALLDNRGRALATLSADKDGAALTLSDSTGERITRYGCNSAADRGANGAAGERKSNDKSGESSVAATN